MTDVSIGLPSALAAELVEEGLAEEVIVWRGVDVVTLLTLAADITSAITAVVASRDAFATIARRLVRHVSGSAGDARELRISVSTPGGINILVEVNDEAGRARLEVGVVAAMNNALEATEDGVDKSELTSSTVPSNSSGPPHH